MSTPIRLGQLGRGRKWAEFVADTGERIPIVDDDGREIAWLVPATEPVTDELLDELVQQGLWRRETLENLGRPTGDGWLRYHRARNVFVFG